MVCLTDIKAVCIRKTHRDDKCKIYWIFKTNEVILTWPLIPRKLVAPSKLFQSAWASGKFATGSHKNQNVKIRNSEYVWKFSRS